MTPHHRLRRLEESVAERGCPGYRDRRGRTVIGTAEQLPDGSRVQEPGDPGPCVGRGQFPERIVRLVEVMVEGREDGSRRGEQGPPGSA
jgi:hypothetical protein